MVGHEGDYWRPPASHSGLPPRPPDMFHFQANTSRDSYHPRAHDRRDFRRRRPPPPATADRPLFQSLEDENEDFASGNALHKFRNPAELTDSEESAMDVSGDESDAAPAAKRARTHAPASNQDTSPKWSNPDPYTALPPPVETNGKRVDLVKLIRKARMDRTNEDKAKAEAEDFISFGADGEMSEGDHSLPPIDAPRGPRAAPDSNLGKRKRDTSTVASRAKAVKGGRSRQGDGMVLPEWVSSSQSTSTPWVTTVDPNDPPSTALHKEIIDFYQWVKPRDFEAAIREDLVDRLSRAMNRLEQGELKAFGSYAAGLYLPTADMDLVYNDRSFNPRRTGAHGLPPKVSFNVLRKWSDFLKYQGIARKGSVQTIGFAKVPIIKFVDDLSGLKVDLSFNNNTGVVAIETFHNWKQDYPAMPIIVSIIKQYLMIRGMNDVSVGGLGGFSVICLVTSMIQHLPLSGKPPNLGQLLLEFFNLYGNILAKDDVGIRLDPPGYVDKDTYRLMNVAGEKRNRLMIIDPNRPDNNISGGTTEIDSILSCFANAHELLQNRMSEHASYDSGETASSLLQDLVGGNFDAYELQRDILRDLYYGKSEKPAPAVVPPPPPPIKAMPIPPPPPSVTTAPTSLHHRNEVSSRQQARGSQSTIDDGEEDDQEIGSSAPGSARSAKPADQMTKGEKRAERMKHLRPDIASKIGKSLSKTQALKIGGYKTGDTMAKDLNKREAQMKKTQTTEGANK